MINYKFQINYKIKIKQKACEIIIFVVTNQLQLGCH
jgi:hypothetical protein